MSYTDSFTNPSENVEENSDAEAGADMRRLTFFPTQQ